MQTFQKIFNAQIEELVSFPKVGTKLIEKRFDKLGITLSDEQLTQIENKLSNLEDGSLSITIDDDQLRAASLNSEDSDKPFEIDLKDSEEELEQFFDQIIDKIQDAIPEIVNEISDSMLEDFSRKVSSIVEESRRDRISFETNLIELWKHPLDLLEMQMVLALEAGAEFNEEFREIASTEQDYVFDVLTRLHARACLVASEVLTLLKSGYADGAHARWRSLHEIAVVGFFIQSFGSDVAERYLLHEGIESYKAAMQYQQHYSALGYDAISTQEFNRIESTYYDLIRRFGSDYKGPYGWAAPEAGRRPTFSDIEKKANLSHLRPFYKMASHNVHANPKGILFKLGLYDNYDILLAGPSNTGLTDPGQATAISLGQITVALLTTRPNIDRLVVCNALMKLSDSIGNEFLKVQKALDKKEAAIQKN